MASGRYVLHERIGVGGMAEVFRASARGAEGFERAIAIKRILPHLNEDQDFLRMFIDEAKIAVQLQHPNIVQILDLGRAGADYFIAMEMVNGKDLRVIQDRVRELGERLPLAVVCHVVMKTCAALYHAHTATAAGGGHALGIVHRDVSPQNVMVSFDGEVKVTDFGLAKAAGRVVQTESGVIKGKLAYMSPEQLTMGVAIDHRSDIYGVGILLWEMLTGQRLFLGKNDIDTVTKVQLGIVPSLRELDPTIPEELERITLRALARDRDERYPSAEEIHDDLEAFAYGTQTFITSASLGAWLRERFPPPAPDKRGPDVATREIRLADVGSPTRRPQPRTTSDLPTENVVSRDQLDPAALAYDDDSVEDELDPDDVEAIGDSVLPPEPVGPTSYAVTPVAPPQLVMPAASSEDFDEPTLEPAREPWGPEHDTTRPPPPDPFFDDTTGNMSARQARELVEKSISMEEPLDDLSSVPPEAPRVPRVTGPPIGLAPGPVPGQPAVQPIVDPWADMTMAEPGVLDAFDDTTGKVAPRVVEASTEQRYDRDLVGMTVEIRGGGWEDDETTQITSAERPLPPSKK